MGDGFVRALGGAHEPLRVRATTSSGVSRECAGEIRNRCSAGGSRSATTGDRLRFIGIALPAPFFAVPRLRKADLALPLLVRRDQIDSRFERLLAVHS